MTDSEFQFRLFEVIVRRNLSIKDVSRCVGASFPTVCRWLRGENAPVAAIRPAFISHLELYQPVYESTST